MDTLRDGLSFDDVLLIPKRSSVTDLSAVDISTQLTPEYSLETPILGAAMDTVTEAEMAIALSRHGGLGVIHRFVTPDEQADMVIEATDAGASCAAALGVGENGVPRAEAVVAGGADVLVIDIAHGHLDACIETIEAVKEEYHNVPLVAGNVATADAVTDLAEAGADAVKVGIGPGSHCTTRAVTGAGVPQLSAIHDCAPAAEDAGVCLIADGGIRTSGEIVKALMAGADTVMLGGLLMGTDEAPGEIVEHQGGQYKRSRGMASKEARSERTDADGDDPNAAEGIEGLSPYKGPVEDVLDELCGGLRSGISYCGGHSLAEAKENAEFIRVSDGAKSRERAHGHGIVPR